MAPGLPPHLAVLETWRNRCATVSSQSGDALLPVLSKGFEAMAALFKPGGSRNDFVRALSSLALERENSLQFDGRRNVAVREQMYGVMECIQKILMEMDKNGWKPVWNQQDERTATLSKAVEQCRMVQDFSRAKSLPAVAKRGGGVQREMQRVSQQQQKKKVKQEPMDEDEEAPRMLVPQKNEKMARAGSAAPITHNQVSRAPARPDFLALGSMKREEEEDSEVGAPLRRDFSRAKSLPAAAGIDKKGGGVVKRKGLKRGTLGCPHCDWHYGNSPSTVITHLRVHHGVTATQAGCYFRCACGHVSRSNNHYQSCAGAKFTLVRDEDEAFRPKRSCNVQRREKGKEQMDKKSTD